MKALEAKPSDDQRLLWKAARILGLNPFGEEARRLSRQQLHWAILRDAEDSGHDLLEVIERKKDEQLREDAMNLSIWMDKHFTRTPK